MPKVGLARFPPRSRIVLLTSLKKSSGFNDLIYTVNLQLMSDAKIYVDGDRRAVLHVGRAATDYSTLRDAVKAWHNLRPELARNASIRVIGGAM